MPKEFYKSLFWALFFHGSLFGLLILTWPFLARNVFSFDRYQILRVSLVDSHLPQTPTPLAQKKGSPADHRLQRKDSPSPAPVPSPPEKPAPVGEKPAAPLEAKAEQADSGMIFAVPVGLTGPSSGQSLGEKGIPGLERSSEIFRGSQGASLGNKGPGSGTSLAVPRYGQNRPPFYPQRAREQGWQGTTLLKVLVLATGTVGNAEVIHSSGFAALDQSAMRGVKEWKFIPGQKDGQATDMWVQIPITFKLE
jgi:protein TonB